MTKNVKVNYGRGSKSIKNFVDGS